MSKYKVEYDPHVLKKLAKLDATARNRIKNWIETNLVDCEDPRAHGHALHYNLREFWSYRVGGWRLIAKIEDDKLVIFLVDVDKREDAYR